MIANVADIGVFLMSMIVGVGIVIANNTIFYNSPF